MDIIWYILAIAIVVSVIIIAIMMNYVEDSIVCNDDRGSLYRDIVGNGSRSPYVTYQKVYGPMGRIYSLNVYDDGTFEITNIGGGSVKLIRSGRLTRPQWHVAHRIATRQLGACPLTPTGADSVTSRVVRYSRDVWG